MSLIDQEFEAEKIINDRIEGGESYYLVCWKNTYTNNINLYVSYKNEIKKLIKYKNEYCIIWKSTWLPVRNLQNCDEILGAYLLLKLYNYRD